MTSETSTSICFDSLASENRAAVVRYLARLVGDADAEDVVPIELSKASAGLTGFRGEASPRSWLFRISTHAALDRLRSHGAHGAAMPSEPPVRARRTCAPESPYRGPYRPAIRNTIKPPLTTSTVVTTT